MTTDAMLQGARTLLNRPIHPDSREAIRAYIDSVEPTQADWDRIFSLKVTPSMRRGTVWQGVLLADPTFQRDKHQGMPWNTLPSPFTVARALRILLTPFKD